jgi:glycosyltransferase involved in cell wall biosynthesis
MRIIALVATYNEERFVAGCIEHLLSQGVEVYLIDNSSTDQTVSLAESYLDRGLIAIDNLPRTEVFNLRAILRRKQEIAVRLEADWFMHVDADEVRLPPDAHLTLAQAFSAVDAEGFNAINFQEFTFIPTIESPDHDHPDFKDTMRWYYPFLPVYPHRLNAWKRQPDAIDLVSNAGHRVQFPGLKMYPQSFILRHYLFLSISHAIRKYSDRRHEPEAVARGWHGWRDGFAPAMIRLPSVAELRTYRSDSQLDSSNPRTEHYIAGVAKQG